jgi:hypothetical protein
MSEMNRSGIEVEALHSYKEHSRGGGGEHNTQKRQQNPSQKENILKCRRNSLVFFHSVQEIKGNMKAKNGEKKKDEEERKRKR